jgi:hypothetical protein
MDARQSCDIERKKSGNKKKIMVLLRNVFGQIFSKFGLLVVLILAGICVPIVFQLITFAKDFDPQNVRFWLKQKK